MIEQSFFFFVALVLGFFCGHSILCWLKDEKSSRIFKKGETAMSLREEFLGLLDKVDQLEAKVLELQSASVEVKFSQAEVDAKVDSAKAELKSALSMKVDELKELLK